MHAPIELVIFDCDGVLVDSEPIAVRVDLVVLERVGLRMSDTEVIDRFVGRSPAVMRAAIEAHLGAPLPAALQDEFAELYRAAYDSQLTAVAGVVEALERIHHRSCVASSSEPDDIRHKLEFTGLLERFEGRIFSASEVPRGKPAPDLFLHAARQMNSQPAGCVVIEDSQYGVQAAHAAGMRVLAYTGGLANPHGVEDDGTVAFSDMRELPNLLI